MDSMLTVDSKIDSELIDDLPLRSCERENEQMIIPAVAVHEKNCSTSVNEAGATPQCNGNGGTADEKEEKEKKTVEVRIKSEKCYQLLY